MSHHAASALHDSRQPLRGDIGGDVGGMMQVDAVGEVGQRLRTSCCWHRHRGSVGFEEEAIKREGREDVCVPPRPGCIT